MKTTNKFFNKKKSPPLRVAANGKSSRDSERDRLERFAITIPVFKQLSYTVNCLNSLKQSGIEDSQIVIVNNGSTDGTAEFLAQRPQLRVIHNLKNLGCGAAWNQGAQALRPMWTIVMNNDVLVPNGWLEGMMDFGEKECFDVVSPAICHGEMDYDLSARAADFMERMKNVFRRSVAHGVCFMVRRRVFDAIGYFEDDPKLGGYEDDEFFRRARRAGFRLAITGCSFIHHFGSVTQKSIKARSNGTIKSVGDLAYYRRKTGQTWFKRKITQTRNNLRNARWRYAEQLRHGQTLNMRRVAGTIKHL